jgi:uncharacterized YigZ family protein
MSVSDSFLIVSSGAAIELKVKGSRFIADVIPVDSVERVSAEIDRIRKRDYNATHHCSAFRLGSGGEVFRFNDDGEPGGTAGAPILRQIDARSLTNTLVVVTRYFGGTKLGTGGLIRAYGDAASEALDMVRVETIIRRVRLKVSFAYPDTSPAMHTINRFDVLIDETSYGDRTEMDLSVRKSEMEAFKKAFLNALSGRCSMSDVPEGGS